MEACPNCGAVLVPWPILPAFDGRPVEQVTIQVCPTCPRAELPDPHAGYDGYTLEALEAP